MLLPILAAVVVLGTEDGPTYSGREGQLQVRPPRADESIVIDGVLDEAVWSRAAVLTGFSQYAPSDGRPADDSTQVLVWYSATAMHFGIRAFEQHGAVNATLSERDRITADDYIELLLGTFNDGRQATVFAVNPFGVQADGILVETGATSGGFSGAMVVRERPDLSPDFVFESKGRLTDHGFEVEIRIPFKSLRYQPAEAQTWGLNVVRYVKHSGYEDSWAPALRAASSFLRQSGELRDLSGLRRGIVLDVTPEVTAAMTGARAATGWEYDRGRPEVGATARWGITNNLTMNGTVNPDFSQVESDAGQFTFDPRQSLFFAEKRPFFLDGLEQFTTPNSLIYSRRIVQPVAAAKITGKISGTDVAALAAVDDHAASLTGGDHHPVFAIARVQRDIGRGSRIGIALTDREDGEISNRVASIDSRFVFGGVYGTQFQLAGSQTRIDGTTTSAPLWLARFTRAGRTFGMRYRINGIHEEFQSHSGFISRPGIVLATLSHSLTTYGAPGAFMESLTGEVVLDGTWQYRRFVDWQAAQDRKLHFNVNSQLRGGWTAGVSLLIETFGYDERLYEGYALEVPGSSGGLDTIPFTGTPRLPNLDYVVQGTTPRWSRFDGSVSLIWGRDENFFEWASADIVYATLAANWRPTDRVRLNATYRHQQFDRRTDGSTVGLRRIPRVKVEYQIARPLFVRLVGEYDASRQDALRDDSRTNAPILIYDPGVGDYVRAVARASNRFRGDALVSYQPTPGTVLFLGYGGTSTEPDAMRFRRLRRVSDGWFVKASYLFRM